MAEMLSYLQVMLSNIGDDFFGKVQWPKSTEELSEFVSSEWHQNPILCLNHFGARGWAYVETSEQKNDGTWRINILFAKEYQRIESKD
jgi:hypothetical protein